MSGKGSKRRPKVVSEKVFADSWNKIFSRKKTPKHGRTQVHKDKTKFKRKDKYPTPNYEGPWGKDLGLD